MTTRKPPGVAVPSWVERQIREAQARGAFENLPGAGRPIPGLDRPRHDLDWLAGYLHREDADVSAILPPSLALAREVEQLPTRLARLRAEARVRAVVEDLNRRIRSAYARPPDGPPMRVRPLDVDATVAVWRAAIEAARAAQQAAARRPDPLPPPPVGRRRWFGRRAAPPPGGGSG